MAMETVRRQSSASPPHKHQMKNQKKKTRGYVSSNNKPSENIHSGGILLAPPLSSSYSYPPPPLSLHHGYHQQQQQQQPPPPPQSRYLSCPPINGKAFNRARDQTLMTPKKSNSKIPIKRKDESKIFKSNGETTSETFAVVTSSVNPLGPDPNDLPKDLSSEKISGYVFTLSPPPSSLPLPKFSLRPKLISCHTEAAARVDAGATDNLRRLLHLR